LTHRDGGTGVHYIMPMNPWLAVLLGFFALATVFALIRGLVTMAQGKDIGGVKSNRWMLYRVIFQGCAILVVMILFLTLNR